MSIHSLQNEPSPRELLEARIMDALEGELDQEQMKQLRIQLNAYPELLEQWNQLHQSDAALSKIPKEVFNAPVLDIHTSRIIYQKVEKELFWEQLVPEMKRMIWRVVVPAASIAASLLLYFSSPESSAVSTSTEASLYSNSLVEEITNETQEYAALDQWATLEAILDNSTKEVANE